MEKSPLSLHTSYFWNCLMLKEDCPIFSTTDPKLYYFVVGLLGLYAAFLVIVILDLKFHWNLDKMHQEIDYYIGIITRKVRLVKRDQGRLITTQERTEKQLVRSRQGAKMLAALREALDRDDMRQFNEIIQLAERTINEGKAQKDMICDSFKNA